MEEVLGDYAAFIRNIDDGLAGLGIERAELAMMDHICYRVETLQKYQEMLQKLTEKCIFHGEAQVNGRPIATFEFREYINAAGWTVPYLELPAPKAGKPFTEGLEHAEFVVIGGLDRFERRHAKLDFKHDGMSKLLNPELGLITPGLSVKFNELQLGAVVRIEQRLITKE